MNNFTNNINFCCAPWLHYYRSPTGEHRLCCLADKLPNDQSLNKYQDLKNSSDLKSIRQSMMANELPSICHRCKNLNNNRVYKDDLNDEFSHWFEKIEASTLEDGSTSIDPISLDYRFLNCNLTCLTCNPEFSSKWKTHEKIKPDLPSYQLYDRQFILQEYRDILKNYHWEKVYFAGGEPLLQSEHLKSLQVLLKEDQAQKNGINFFYNTNLNRNEEFITQWVQALNQFKRVTVYVSIDSYGRFNDLIRVGSSFSKIENNLNILLKNKGPNVQVIVDLTITSIFFFNLIEFSKWILSKNLDLNARVMYGEGFLGKFMRIETLSREFRIDMFNLFEKWYFQLLDQEKQKLSNLYEVLKTFHLLPQYQNKEIQEAMSDLKELPFFEIKKEIENLILNFI